MGISVSVIIPIYNAEKYLPQCLDSLLGQTLSDIEIICIDDGSTDGSLKVLEAYQKQDYRVKISSQKNAGAGAARNRGITYANGKYVYFFDADDVADKKLLELAFNRAEETEADIVAFNGSTFTDDDLSTAKLKQGFSKGSVKSVGEVFSYKDYPQSILSIVNVVPWNKLILRSFILEKGLKYEEISSTNDITFSAVAAANASKIALLDKNLMYYRLGHSGTVSSTKTKNLNNVITAVESVASQVETLEYYEEIKPSLMRFVIDNYIFAFMSYTDDFASDISKDYYNFIYERFNSDLFADYREEYVPSVKLRRLYRKIKNTPYDEMLEIKGKQLIVSFTTYPKRISTIHRVVDNIARQSKKADAVYLWLASEQFPNGNADLPQELLERAEQGLVEIRWCDEDIRSHKKYFYAMQEFPQALIVTLDDDLVYPDNIIQTLFECYICNPDCVSAMRAHVEIINFQKYGEVIPYELWLPEYRDRIFEPSMQLFATSGAGTLYPPNVLDKHVFNKEKFLELCPLADDIWLNIMQLVKGTPTVVASDNYFLHLIEGTQETTLFDENVGGGKNDLQYAAVREWIKSEFGEDVVYKHLTESNLPLNLADYDVFSEYLIFLHNTEKQLRRKLAQSNKEKSETARKLKTAYAEKSEVTKKLNQTYEEKAERGRELQKLQQDYNKTSKALKDLRRQTKRSYIFRTERFVYRKLKRLTGKK